MYINPHEDMFQYLVLKDGTMQCMNITYLKKLQNAGKHYLQRLISQQSNSIPV